jgi:transcriptional regulator with XRE-family HTH domain
MKSKSHQPSPKTKKILMELGENIRMARLRRKFSAKMVSERAGISHTTLRRVEKGMPAVSMGVYLQVLFVLGLESDIAQIARDDVLGRKIQDSQISVKARAPKVSSKKESHDQ